MLLLRVESRGRGTLLAIPLPSVLAQLLGLDPRSGHGNAVFYLCRTGNHSYTLAGEPVNNECIVARVIVRTRQSNRSYYALVVSREEAEAIGVGQGTLFRASVDRVRMAAVEVAWRVNNIK